MKTPVNAIVDQLYTRLQLLEKDRQNAIDTEAACKIGAFSGFIILFLISILIMVKANLGIDVFIWGAVLSFLISRSIYTYGTSLLEEYQERYKQAVFPELLKTIHPGLRYHGSGVISRYDFINSKLFENFNTYQGEDLIEGVINYTYFKLGELDVKYQSDDNSTQIFKGLFMTVDLKHRMPDDLIMLPAGEGGNFWTDTLERFFNQPNKRGELIETGDATFDGRFNVYATFTDTVFEFLTEEIRADIQRLNSKVGGGIRMSVIGSHLYMAIPFDGDLFEPNTTLEATDTKVIELLAEEMSIIVDLVEYLSLGDRMGGIGVKKGGEEVEKVKEEKELSLSGDFGDRGELPALEEFEGKRVKEAEKLPPLERFGD